MSKDKDLIIPMMFVEDEEELEEEPIQATPKEAPKKRAKSVTIEVEEVEEEEDDVIDFSMSKFLEDGDDIYVKPVETTQVAPTKRKTKKTKTKSIGGDSVTVADNEDGGDLQHFQTNVPYQDTYQDSMEGLDVAIGQLDELAMAARGDLEELRASKTMRGRHRNISELSTSLASIINTKIGAIKEKNSVIGKSHDLELKRIKDLNLNATNEVDDDRAVQDMYNAFIKMPSGGEAPQSYMPPPMNVMTDPAGMGNGIVTADIGDDGGAFEQYQKNITAVQNRMRYEDNPNIQTVVVYDGSTGDRHFDVRNMKTGESVPNIERPDPMFLEDTTIDLASGIARNANIDTTYPIVEAGPSIQKY